MRPYCRLLAGVSALFFSLVVAVVSAKDADASNATTIEWNFSEDGQLHGWTPNSHLSGAVVRGGALCGKANGSDPILLGPVFSLATTPTQCIEIAMKTTRATTAELFWTETLQGKYGGFSQRKSLTFSTHGDGKLHVYRLHPFWRPVDKIVRFRFDPPNQGRFEIASIRVVDDGGAARSDLHAWRFDTGAHDWRPWQEVSEPVVRDGCLRVRAKGKQPVLMSPILTVPADKNPIVSIRMAVTGGSSGRVLCVSRDQAGCETLGFPLLADGKMHTYNVDVGTLNKWKGRILMLGLQPTDAPGAEARIASIAIAEEPAGPADLVCRYLGGGDAVNRAGRPVQVRCVVRNRGGEPAEGLAATLRAPEGVEILGPSRKTLQPVTYYVPQEATWTIRSAEPRACALSVVLEGPGLETQVAEGRLALTPAPRAAKASYVPRPQPVPSKFELGVFYFPGWHSMARWRPILDFPERKPVLGWYDEANPECVDWQIKWAVEHGIRFFMVDWYWNRGNRHLEHWLHEAYAKAKYRKYLKWAVMWANHNAPGSHSAEDWRKVTRFWIDHYFGMEEYYRIDDRPAVFLWSPANIRRDVGGSEKAAELYALSQKMARQSGYQGIHFVAMFSHDSKKQCEQLKAEGYAGTTSYHGFGPARKRAKSRNFEFADVVETGPELWREEDERSSGLSYIPIVDTGWASQPWHHGKALVIRDRSPELFGQLCRKARQYAEATGKKIIAIGPWNEWGEGSYIEPYAEYGFGDLDQLRDVFCEPGPHPPNLVPSDVGLGPYDLPMPTLKTAWEFETDGDFEGWSAVGMTGAKVAGGLFVARSGSHDPVLNGPGVQIDPKIHKKWVVRMRAHANARAQLFWSTPNTRMCEKNSVGFDIVGDGQFHEYEVDLTLSPQWRGRIVTLRFDPVNRPEVEIAVDWLRLR